MIYTLPFLKQIYKYIDYLFLVFYCYLYHNFLVFMGNISVLIDIFQ